MKCSECYQDLERDHTKTGEYYYPCQCIVDKTEDYIQSRVEEIVDEAFYDGRREGWDEGHYEGYDVGFDSGKIRGYREAKKEIEAKDNFEKGYKTGYAVAEQKYFYDDIEEVDEFNERIGAM